MTSWRLIMRGRWKQLIILRKLFLELFAPCREIRGVDPLWICPWFALLLRIICIIQMRHDADFN